MSNRNHEPTDNEIVAAAAQLSGGRTATMGNGTIHLPGGCTNDIQRALNLTHSTFLKAQLERLVREGRLELRRMAAFRCYVPAHPHEKAS